MGLIASWSDGTSWAPAEGGIRLRDGFVAAAPVVRELGWDDNVTGADGEDVWLVLETEGVPNVVFHWLCWSDLRISMVLSPSEFPCREMLISPSRLVGATQIPSAPQNQYSAFVGGCGDAPLVANKAPPTLPKQQSKQKESQGQNLLEDAVGIPCWAICKRHRLGHRRTLSSLGTGHHHKRGIALAFNRSRRDRRRDGMPSVVDMLGTARVEVLLDWPCRTMPGRDVCAWSRVLRAVGASIRKAWFQHERLGRVGTEGFSNRVDLALHIWHRPRTHAPFQYAHMTLEILPSVRVKIRIRRSDGHLLSRRNPMSARSKRGRGTVEKAKRKSSRHIPSEVRCKIGRNRW